ncbi:MAG: MFS transporter [Verrucomicrobia bacterium]|nr:MFS transporter [Verrucomicrobiota bacterium]
MSTTLYLQLSALMFMEYAVWAAWMPVLAARLLGPLQMTGKQTGWIYATLPLASMISPLFAGQLADKYVDTGYILAFCHGVGIVLLFLAARTKKFAPLFGVMLAYSMLYGATIPLVNSLMFSHLTDAGQQAAGIFIWAPVAWTLIGVMLTGWRNLRKAEGDGSDCLKFAALLSIIMTVVCLLQPATPPKGGGAGSPILQAIGMMSDPHFAVFIIVSLVVAGMMQFYFLGTARFLTDLGVSGKNIPAIMGIAQAAQALATLFLLGLLFDEKVLGPKWTITIGAISWMVLYLIYVLKMPKIVVIVSQVFHGLAYVFFMIAGQMYVGKVAPKEIAGSAQALIILVTVGIGLFLGTQLAGVVMDRFSAGGKFNWSKVFLVPMLLTLAGVIALALAF